jgi:hypothetical protein
VAHKVSGDETAPKGVSFTCPKSGMWVTDGDEKMIEYEVIAVIGHQTYTVKGIKCPGCDNGIVTFEQGQDGFEATHDYATKLK